MISIETILVVLCIAFVVVSVLVVMEALQKRKTRRLVEPLVPRKCPQCGETFGAAVLATAHEIHGLDDPPPGQSLADIGPIPRRISVVCPHCSARWEFSDGVLSKIPVMERHHVPVETSLGFLDGRDCIFLDRVVLDDAAGTVTLEGEVSGSHCSGTTSDRHIPYVLRFGGVAAHKQTDLESSVWGDSCFDEITESEWLWLLGSRVNSKHRHFVVMTYDDVFEVACETYEFLIQESRPRRSVP